MSASVILRGSDNRLQLNIGDAVRQPVYMAYTEVSTATADASTDVITSNAHGLIAGTEILIRTGTGVVPTGLTAGTHYFVRDVTANSFKLSASSGGAAIDITAAGTVGWIYIRQTWTKLRIGLRGAWNSTGNITGTPTFALGLQKGTANGYGALVSDHVVGLKFCTASATSITYNAGPTAYYSLAGANAIHHFKKVAGVVSATLATAALTMSADTGTVRSGIFIEIIKGLTPSTWKWYMCGPNVAAGAQSDLTDAEFDSIMAMPNMDTANIAAVKTNYANFAANGGTAFAASINESTDGVLDNLFVYSDRASTTMFEWDIKHALIS